MELKMTPDQLNDPNYISEEIIRLAGELDNDSQVLALAELAEDKYAVELLNGPEKISVAQAEKEALVHTNNTYHEAKYKREAKIEMINALKSRLKVLSWEYEKAGTL